jgi:hypothetical protein
MSVPTNVVPVEIEDHLTIDQIAEKLHVSVDTARRIFVNEPGVILLPGKPSRFKRQYQTLRVPVSVFRRVYARMQVKKAA